MWDWLKTTNSKKESISKDLNDLSAKAINDTFSKENLEKTENSKKLFSKDEEVKKKVKEEFKKNLRAQLNEDNQRYIKKDELNKYCDTEIEKKTLEFEEQWQKEIDKKEKEEREREIRELNSWIGR
jgi:hypothetical protein